MLALAGSNSFGGGATITQGTLRIGGANALGLANTATITFVDGAATDLQLNGNAIAPNLVVGPSLWRASDDQERRRQSVAGHLDPQ